MEFKCAVKEPGEEQPCGITATTTLTIDYAFNGTAGGQHHSFVVPMCQAHHVAFSTNLTSSDLAAFAASAQPSSE